jgi:dUTP pyrophosphatase
VDEIVGRGPSTTHGVETATFLAPVPVPVRQLDPGLPLPSYAHDGDAGADLYSAVDIVLDPGQRSLVPTGVAIALPPGYVGLVHPRSGLASRLGVTVLNAPGTVDSGYRGEILVNLINHDPRDAATIRRGDRIAQLVVQRVERADFHGVDELSESARGADGHGSTGGLTALGEKR